MKGIGSQNDDNIDGAEGFAKRPEYMARAIILGNKNSNPKYCHRFTCYHPSSRQNVHLLLPLGSVLYF